MSGDAAERLRRAAERVIALPAMYPPYKAALCPEDLALDIAEYALAAAVLALLDADTEGTPPSFRASRATWAALDAAAALLPDEA